MYRNFGTKHFLVKIANINVFPTFLENNCPICYSFGIRLLGFKCSWWHPRHANDAIGSEQSIFSKNHDHKSLICVAVNLLVPIFWDLHACGGRKLLTDTHTHTHMGQLQ